MTFVLLEEKFNITWDTCQFIMFRCVTTVIAPNFYEFEKKAKTFQRMKACRKRFFLLEPFLPSQPKIGFETETARNNPHTFSRETDNTEDSELSLLESSLRRWIPNPGVPCSKPLGGSKADSVFHPSEVDKMSTRNFLVVKNKLPPRSGSSLEALEPHP